MNSWTPPVRFTAPVSGKVIIRRDHYDAFQCRALRNRFFVTLGLVVAPGVLTAAVERQRGRDDSTSRA